MSDLSYLDPYPGHARVVLLLHGLGADGSSWALQFPALGAAGFRPVAPDAPGFGRSAYDGRGWSARRYADLLKNLLDELGVDAAHLVGLSMGGVIAQQFALDHPERVRHLVLASTFARLRPSNLSELGYFLSRAVLVHTLGLPVQAGLVARRVFPDPGQDALRAMLIDSITGADPRAYRAVMRALGTFNSLPRLKDLRIPVLVATGAEDSTVSPAAQSRLADAIPGARQVVFANAGHALSIDQADAFNRELLAFLS